MLNDAHTVDEGAEQAVVAERGANAAQLLRRWRAAEAAQRRHLRCHLARSEPKRRLPWVVGELSPRTLATTRLSEMWIHTADIADALGIELVPADRLWHIARLAWRHPALRLRPGRTCAARPGCATADQAQRSNLVAGYRRPPPHHRSGAGPGVLSRCGAAARSGGHCLDHFGPRWKSGPSLGADLRLSLAMWA
jgi:hypothetical protein